MSDAESDLGALSEAEETEEAEEAEEAEGAKKLRRRSSGPIDLNSCLGHLLGRFQSLDVDQSGAISHEELVKHCLDAAQEVATHPLTPSEQALIVASVQRNFETMDLENDGLVTQFEWLHAALLELHPPGAVNVEIITKQIKAQKFHPDLVEQLVCRWLEVDEKAVGLVTRKLLRLTYQSIPHDQHDQHDLIAAMQKMGTETLTYAEYVAHALGLNFSNVTLYYYDLSKSFASAFSTILLDQYEEGIWHTSVGILGKELYFYGCILSCEPGGSKFGQPTKSISLGSTLRSLDEVNEEIARIYFEYQPHLYDAFDHNCNTLSNHLVHFLLGRPMPESVRSMSERLKSSSFIKSLRPVLNRVLGRPKQDGDDRMAELEESWRMHRIKRREEMKPTSKLNFSEPQGSDGSDDDQPLFTDESAVMRDTTISDLVLFRAPGSHASVVARVAVEHSDGSADLVWFDHAGKRQHATAKLSDLEPYRPVLSSIASIREDEPPCLPHCSSTDTCIGDVEAAGYMTCPAGHVLLRSQPSFWTGTTSCKSCRQNIPHRQVRMTCHVCKYSVCGSCFLQSRSPSVGQNPAALSDESSALVIRCTEGHRLERFGGGSPDAGACCSRCSGPEIGSTGPFFLSCRRCFFQLCYSCARASLCALIDEYMIQRVCDDNGIDNADEAVRRCFAERSVKRSTCFPALANQALRKIHSESRCKM
eukprot:Skav207218  [mRNA]  locus=scaffold1244:164346:166457:+ [translate_table: standard]